MEREAARHLDALSIDPLIRGRARVADVAERSADHQIAVFVDRQLFRAAVGKPNIFHTCARLHGELVRKLAAVAAEEKIDARPEVAVNNLTVRRQVCMPPRGIVPDQVIDRAAPHGLARDRGPRIRVEEAETQHEALAFRGEREDRFVRREVETSRARLRQVVNASVELPGIRDKAKRQIRIRPTGLGGRSGGLSRICGCNRRVIGPQGASCEECE